VATNKHYTEKGNLIFGLCEDEPDEEEMTARIESGHLDWHRNYQPCPHCGAISCVWARGGWLWCLTCRTPTTWSIIEDYKDFLDEQSDAEKLEYIHQLYKGEKNAQ